MDSRKLFNKQDRKDKKKKDKKEKERKKSEEKQKEDSEEAEVLEPEQKRSRKSSKVTEEVVAAAEVEEAKGDEINYLDEKEKKAEMLMEADKQNDAEAKKGDEKAPLKDDKYFSETKFTQLNMSEQTQKAVSELGYTTCSEI